MKTLGILMLAAPVAAIYIAIGLRGGWWNALAGFSIGVGAVVWFGVAVWLVNR